jgi:hypothetical protein
MQPFSEGFTAPTWDHVLVLIVGSILTPGRRTVAAALRMVGLEQTADFTNYHRVLNRNRWSSCGRSLSVASIGWKNCVAEVRQALDAWRTIDGFAAGSQAGKKKDKRQRLYDAANALYRYCVLVGSRLRNF